MNCSHPRLPAWAGEFSSGLPSERHSYDSKFYLAMMAAVAITMVLYLPNLGKEFVEWDLIPYWKILTTTDYGKTAWALFTDLNGTVVSGYYAPIGSISLMFDKALVGSSTTSPQATLFINLLLHCLNGVLVFALLRRAGGSGGVALLGTAIFLMHPVQVSSVAWFAQRKGLLAASFYLAAFLAYFRYMEKGGLYPYLFALVFFLLAVLTKPTAVVLPAALLCTSFLLGPPPRRREPGSTTITGAEEARSFWDALRVWFKIPLNPPLEKGEEATPTPPLVKGEKAILSPPFVKGGRGDFPVVNADALASKIPFCDSSTAERQPDQPSPAFKTGFDRQTVVALARSLKPLVPFLFVAAVMALAVTVSERAGMDERVPDLALADRSIVSAAAAWFYIAKVLIPIDFTPIYPQWEVDVASPTCWLPAALLVVALAVVWRFRRKVGPFPLWCLANFIIPLLPVIGIVKFAYLRHSYVADHFMYLPMVGLAGLLAACVDKVRNSFGHRTKYAVTAAAAAYLAFCAVQTVAYSKAWETSVGLWTYNLQRNPNDWTAHNFLGHALLKSGRHQEAADHFQKTVALKQQYILQHEARGRELKTSGNSEAANREAEKARKVQATLGGSYHNLGNAYLFAKMHHQAIAAYNTAVELKPDLVDALTNLGVAHAGVGNLSEAVRWLSQAVRINPQYYQAQYNLGVAYDMAGDREKAQRHFEKARAIRGE